MKIEVEAYGTIKVQHTGGGTDGGGVYLTVIRDQYGDDKEVWMHLSGSERKALRKALKKP